MLSGTWLKVAAAAVMALLVFCLAMAWRANRRQQEQLQQQLNSAQQALQQANAREQERDAAAKQQVAQLQKQEQSAQTPADILKALPQVLPLPAPLVLNATTAAPASSSATPSSASKLPPESPVPSVSMPVQDLKPLYDGAIACKECLVELAAAQADLKDEQVKTDALSRERDDALRAAKGGSVLRRVARAAKWFALGAAAGAVAAKFAR